MGHTRLLGPNGWLFLPVILHDKIKLRFVYEQAISKAEHLRGLGNIPHKNNFIKLRRTAEE